MRILHAFVCLGIALGARAARAGQMPADVASLVAAERAFAKMSVTVSMRDAFLEFLADDGIVFRPGPVNGREVYRARPASDVVLAWEPVYAEIAASGDFGFTTGPWEFRPNPDAEPAAFGHFVSVWKKQADGRWKVALDIGINHDRPASRPPLAFRASTDPDPWPRDAKGVAEARAALLAAEHAFAEAAVRGAANAFRTFGADDVRRYRAGSVPITGADTVVSAAGDAGGTTMAVIDADIATSCDLGYTMGSRGAPVSAYYLRIWRLEDRAWKIVLDLESALPAEGE